MNNYFRIIIKTVCLFLILIGKNDAQSDFDYVKLDSLIIVSKESKSDSLKCVSLFAIGELYYESDIEKAIEYYKKAYVYALKLPTNQEKTNVLNKLGYTYYYTSDYSNSIKCFLECLREFSKSNSRHSIASMHNNIAVIYDELNDTVNAIKHHRLALYIRKSLDLTNLDNKNNLAQSYGNIGKTYYSMNRHGLSIENYEIALKIYKETNNKKGQALMYNNIGTYYADQGDYIKANDFFNKAITLYNEIKSFEKLTICLINVAEIYHRTGDHKQAIIKYNEALNMAISRKNKDDMKTCYEGLNNVYTDMKDYKLAHEYLLKYYQTKDSIFSEENNTQINEMLTKFDSEKKDQEIQLLQKDKEITEWLRNSLIIGLVFVLVVSFLIYSRYKVKNKSNLELSEKNKRIEDQKRILEIHQKEIVDSINYAKRIQFSLIPGKEILDKYFPSAFVFFKPKDIVSGDFYWTTSASDHGSVSHNYIYLAVCDSTGHGVPGAFMSLLNMGFISEAIKEKEILKPHLILNYVRERLIETISKDGQQDGFDGVLLQIDLQSEKIFYAGANCAPLLVRSNQTIELGKDKMPVGKGENLESFTLREINYFPNDTLYLYTDGFADQFGGPKGKKFMYKKLNQLLCQLALYPLPEQKEKLERTFDEWKNNLEQVDDVCIIGIKL